MTKGTRSLLFPAHVTWRPACYSAEMLPAAAAIKQLARNLSVEWARDTIRVVTDWHCCGCVQCCCGLADHLSRCCCQNDIAPGYVRTPLVEGVLNNEDVMSKMRLRVPQKRVSDPEEISGGSSCMDHLLIHVFVLFVGRITGSRFLCLLLQEQWPSYAPGQHHISLARPWR